MTGPATWLMLNGLAALLLSWIGVGLATEYARRVRILAEPGARQSHVVATPTGGGLGLIMALVVLSFAPGFAFLYPAEWTIGILPGLTLLSLVGWLDDRTAVTPLLRLAVQLAVSIWLLLCLRHLGYAWNEPAPVIATAAIVLALVWMMNAYNFMDGSNGMAGAQGVFSGILLAWLFWHAGSTALAVPALAIGGACLGFLPWNFPRPRVFMGDAGSVALGFALGGLMLLGVLSGSLSIPVALLVLPVFLVDSSFTLARRILTGERWYTAHNKHAYQRLIVAGWSHGRVLTLYQAINLFLVLPGVVMGTMYPDKAWTMTGTVYMLLVIIWSGGSLKHGGKS